MKKKNELTIDERAQAEAVCALYDKALTRIDELELLLSDARGHAETPPTVLPEWSDVNETWSTICKSAVDTSRLVGLEIELEGGRRYLIGDLSCDGGTGPANMPFPRSALVKRARVLVRR